MKGQNKPGTDRSLYYDLDSGRFTLLASTHVIIRCPMYFKFYPFDKQQCNFVMTAAAKISQSME